MCVSNNMSLRTLCLDSRFAHEIGNLTTLKPNCANFAQVASVCSRDYPGRLGAMFLTADDNLYGIASEEISTPYLQTFEMLRSAPYVCASWNVRQFILFDTFSPARCARLMERSMESGSK